MPILYLFLLMFLLPTQTYAQISADHWNGGAVRVGPSTTICDGNAKGALRYDSTQNVLKFCDGGNWRTMGATISGSDSTPDVFSFTDVTNQPLNTMIFSNVMTITGIDPDQTVTVTGAGTPQISVNNGPWVAAASISPGDELQVRLISANIVTTLRNAVVTVGTVSDTWSVTTRAGQTQVFITSTLYSGDFGNIAMADSICMARASAGGLPGVWKAVISDSATNAKDRVTITYPVVNIRGDVMATANFWGESFQAHVYTEFNALPGDSSQFYVWNGTGSGGLKSVNNCTDWSSPSVSGRIGRLLTGDVFPTAALGGTQMCSTYQRIACLQQ